MVWATSPRVSLARSNAVTSAFYPPPRSVLPGLLLTRQGAQVCVGRAPPDPTLTGSSVSAKLRFFPVGVSAVRRKDPRAAGALGGLPHPALPRAPSEPPRTALPPPPGARTVQRTVGEVPLPLF